MQPGNGNLNNVNVRPYAHCQNRTCKYVHLLLLKNDKTCVPSRGKKHSKEEQMQFCEIKQGSRTTGGNQNGILKISRLNH